ncbi:Lipid A export ATP-binding/permease protein MsbA [Candidatus Izimaplasma bacterium HR1]|jgi:ABC-type multidrug transport system fused ATPase/permease subunit|uniref:ABC transporter ATP-binding protein n=1 Tax=Candidatus Izimoplasma sp. HR1 TaxID=1541959 RepID=UPI0004F5AA6B|nr:Lipid A export ATP-binding/permease protein MsbA [Candidatus Izimaplasma bacterium HR1]
MNKTISKKDVYNFHIGVFKEDKEMFMILIFILNMIITGSIPLVAVIFPKYIIDSISSSDLKMTLIFIGLFGVVSMILTLFSIKLNAMANGRFQASSMRRKRNYAEKFKNVSMSHLEDANFHAKRNEAFDTMKYSNRGFHGTLTIVFQQLPEIFCIIGFIIILGLFNPIVIVAAFICAIAQFLLALKAKDFMIHNHGELAERDRNREYYYDITHDSAFGKDIRINNLANSLYNRFVLKTKEFLELLKAKDLNEHKFSLFDVPFLLITNGLTYYLVIRAYFQGSVSLGTISMAIMTVLAITIKLQTTFKEIARLKEETARTMKYISFFSEEYDCDSEDGTVCKFEDVNIEFRNVSFQYPSSSQEVLKNVSFKISNNKKIALVGINGSGKTTIVKLLCGFYVPTKGDIFINGINTKDINLKSYQENIAVVFQDVNLYAATILENITGQNPSEEEKNRAIDALNQAGLLDRVKEYKNQENQNLLKVIEKDGVDLSGGEAQKLAIARAIYKENTKLIILDEPTAALDAIAEKRIYEKFSEIVDNQTAIMISHRLASTKFCDSIIFLENGMIYEEGSHNELMNYDNGKYKNMFMTQGKYYQNDEVNYDA